MDPAPGAGRSDDRSELGLTAFKIEGRRAPALFVVGWLATLIGLGLLVIALLGAAGLAGAVISLASAAALAAGLLLLAGSQAIERRAAHAPYAGPSPVVVFVAVVATTRLAAYVVGLPLLAVADAIPAAVGDLLAVIVQAVVFIGVVRLAVIGTNALSWPEMGLGGRRGDVLRALATGAVFAGPVILVTSVVAVLAVQAAGATPTSPLPPTGTTLGLALHLVAGAAIAPVAEEVLFRGFALTAWQRTLGPTGAIVRSSLLFVVAHILFVGGDTFEEAARLAFVGGVVRVPVAFALGWLYVRTGSLWAPIGLHAVFNGILIVAGELAPPV